ncbi:MAG: D-alanine--D-alanine ligase [Gammaproteobacteria bacterium]
MTTTMRVQDPTVFGRVAVLMGGWSAEREISLMSGEAVLQALLRRGVDAHGVDADKLGVVRQLTTGGFDRAFVVLHGRGGEDGVIQAVLEMLGIPYTGSGVMASALTMDKWRTRLLWQAAGIPGAPYERLNDRSEPEEVVARLGLPLFVKPACEGSSIGITKVKSAAALRPAYEEARRYDEVVLAEAFITGAEVQFPVLGHQVLPSVRVETSCEFYDYQAKYFRDDTRYTCPGLPPAQEQGLHEAVLRAFDVSGCRGWARVDLIVTPEGAPYFLEINTVPGMTGHSLVPMGARAAGIEFDELVWWILETSLRS